VRKYRWPASFLSLFMVGSPAAFARTTVHQLGVAPLLGASSTTSEVREKVRTHPRLMHLAASGINLSSEEYEAFYRQLMSQRPGWVTVPRRLDAMSWSAGGVVHVEHDVIIPKGVQGWEVDLFEKRQVVHIYLPMVCGNLSVLRTPRNEVAVLPPPPHRIPVQTMPTVQPLVPLPVMLDGFSQKIPPVISPTPIVHHLRLFWPIVGTAVLATVLLAHPHHGAPSNVVTPQAIPPPPPIPPSVPVPPVPPVLPVPPIVPSVPSVPILPIPCSIPTPPPCGCMGQTWNMSRHSGAFSIGL
jgi:hypothetical protein